MYSLHMVAVVILARANGLIRTKFITATTLATSATGLNIPLLPLHMLPRILREPEKEPRQQL